MLVNTAEANAASVWIRSPNAADLSPFKSTFRPLALTRHLFCDGIQLLYCTRLVVPADSLTAVALLINVCAKLRRWFNSLRATSVSPRIAASVIVVACSTKEGYLKPSPSILLNAIWRVTSSTVLVMRPEPRADTKARALSKRVR